MSVLQRLHHLDTWIWQSIAPKFVRDFYYWFFKGGGYNQRLKYTSKDRQGVRRVLDRIDEVIIRFVNFIDTHFIYSGRKHISPIGRHASKEEAKVAHALVNVLGRERVKHEWGPHRMRFHKKAVVKPVLKMTGMFVIFMGLMALFLWLVLNIRGIALLGIMKFLFATGAVLLSAKTSQLALKRCIRLSGQVLQPDFWIPHFGLYVEYWGWADSNWWYAKHMLFKQGLYKKHSIRVIDVYPQHVRQKSISEIEAFLRKQLAKYERN